jgi:cation:H+ antiporter
MDSYIYFAIGLILLPIGSEILVRGAVGLAERWGISPLVVGLTIVAFGTSAPELLVSLNAALKGSAPLAVGNVVGSNIANIMLILGISGLIYPMVCKPDRFLKDSGTLLSFTIFFVAFILDGTLERWQGGLLFSFLIFYLVFTYFQEMAAKEGTREHEEEVHEFEGMAQKSMPYLWGAVALGLAGVLFGADFLVTGATDIARAAGVSEEIIGLTMVAIGTSLPELATTVAASLRRHNDMALGGIIGSNIFNLLGILGITAVVTPLEVPAQILRVDIWVMAAATIILIPFMLSGRRLDRVEAGAFLFMYIAYITLQYTGAIG